MGCRWCGAEQTARAALPAPVVAHPAACEQPRPTTLPRLARTRVGNPEDNVGHRGELAESYSW
eukprot:5465869-Prymnesium_polylepis.1